MRKVYLISSILCFFCIEIVSKIALDIGIVQDIYTEKGVKSPKHIANQGLTWRIEKDLWGAWHRKNFVSRHTKSCFDIDYISNNIGARDSVDYNNKFPDDSIIALGDSFIEGFGVDQKEIFTAKLESYTGKKVFNLGSAFQFGPLQYYLIYKHIGVNLPHKTVVLALLPGNDFKDNDIQVGINYTYHKFFKKPRYRPYYDVTNSKENYPIIYPRNAIKRSKMGRYGLHKFIASQSIRLNIVRLYKNVSILRRERRYVSQYNPEELSPYYSGSEKQQEAAIFYLKKTYELAKSNGVTNFIVLSIPTMSDFLFASKMGSKREIPYWENQLIQFSKDNNDFQYIDGLLISEILEEKEDYQSLFLPCDGHWSSTGSSLSAKLVNKFLK